MTPSATAKNEAAEGLLDWLDKSFTEPVIAAATYRAMRRLVVEALGTALANERQAGRMEGWGSCMCDECEPKWRKAILDAEAAR